MSSVTKRTKRGPKKTVTTSSAADLMADAVRETVRAEIRAADGNEVFFIGRTDERGIVTEIAIGARGNLGAVSAYLGTSSPGDVVIHNHPSGPLTPSDADVEFSSMFGAMGVGSYIVDNAVERVYVVVPVLERVETKKLDAEQTAALLRPGGALQAGLASYEFRTQQVDMIEAVIEAFNSDEIALIEATTGTGKTVAYLIPAILWATANGERVVVSTNTINLQEQLIHKDIPMLRRVLGVQFEAVLMKGRGNYVCLRKLQRVASDVELFSTAGDRTMLADIITWARKSKNGDRSQLSFVPPQEIWEKVASEADFCLRAKCPHFKSCFVNRARRTAAQADIIVANHHLLFADIALRRQLGTYSDLAVLPPYQRLIIDEAHNVEDVATSYLGDQITRTGLARIIGRLHRYERGKGGTVEKGVLPFLRAKIIRSKRSFTVKQAERLISTIDGTLIPMLEGLLQVADAGFDAVFLLVEEQFPEPAPEKKLRITDEVRNSDGMRAVGEGQMEALVRELIAVAKRLETLAGGLSKAGTASDNDEDFSLDREELNAYGMRLRAVASFISAVFSDVGDENTVQWIETRPRDKPIVRLCAAPLEVSSALVETVYPHIKTIVMTSATLSVAGRLDFLKFRLGLDRVDGARLRDRILPSPFDYEQQAMIGIPSDIADPAAPHYMEQVVEMVLECIRITQGKALVLFTSFNALNYCFQNLHEMLADEGIASFKQGTAPRHRLLEQFKRDVNSVLFATDSFWEGVDVEGEALECLILAKLPFRVPTEPVLEARAEKIEEDGDNSFVEYTVPQAVIRFRQGFGRLIRRRTDRGAVVILDSRVLTRSYGRAFLESLPEARLVCMDRLGVLAALREFFES